MFHTNYLFCYFLISLTNICLLFTFTNAQSIDDCGHTKGCFIHPRDCTGNDCLFIYKWADNSDKTDFEISAYIQRGSIDSTWLAIGFSYDRKMGNDCVVMCQHAPSQNINKIEHYYNVKKSTPIILDPSNPTVGLSNPAITSNNGFLTCKFTRVKMNNSINNYFDINNKFYALGANGDIDEGGDLQFHGKARTASQTLINFESYNIYTTEATLQTKVQIHASLAIVTWILFVSTGIIIARYFKGLLEDLKPCKVNVWFFLHRPIMITAACLSIASFIIILSYKGWQWIYSGDTSSFIHSIFGIITLSLLWIQPIIAMLRCDKDHPRRYIFNGIHFLFGTTAFIFSLVTMFIAFYMASFESNTLMAKILIGWCCWIIFLVISLEILSYAHSMRVKNVNNETISLISKSIRVEKYSKWKVYLLVIHILLASATSSVLIYFIFSS